MPLFETISIYKDLTETTENAEVLSILKIIPYLSVFALLLFRQLRNSVLENKPSYSLALKKRNINGKYKEEAKNRDECIRPKRRLVYNNEWQLR
jgi:hypothetical protein